MEYLSNDHKDCSNQHENSHKPFDETDHTIVNFIESSPYFKPIIYRHFVDETFSLFQKKSYRKI